MSASTAILKVPEVVYPESDGLPLSDNTRQFRWIMTIQGGLEAQYSSDANVFVAGNLLWYPVEGDNKTRTAPDVMVALGRLKGDRGSYRQWVEGDIAPQVVFEIVSPGNSAGVLTEKFNFYNRFGVEEYYLYDPDENQLDGWIRREGSLTRVDQMDGWVSPLLGIRFDLSGPELRVMGKAGEPFVPTAKALQQRNEAMQQRDEAMQAQTEAERTAALAREANEKLKAQLRQLGVEPEA